ncbi:AzlC family ABC transporter permease [Marimonas arenosa]|uniref:AzlC family ABC transporter permease n=1 Tax=Marimonas arenosa TaxID=1795305 RepID=A0AAE4B5V6_9RHOB|nr:AzlC family ABC transporter permease [Marimonas arenosa]MDQ2092373.1 AzlC family ABC transporter permease [Marimonas arenosa]
MPPATAKSPFWMGVRAGAPFILVVVPFAALFGLVATEAGLNLLETLGFSFAVVAGAAQFTALQLMQEQAPVLVVLISALAVNLRLAMYSAALTPHLGAAPLWQRAFVAYMTVDQSFTTSIAAYDRHPHWRLGQKTAFFFGACTPVLPAWLAATIAGALAGQHIPPDFALDFAVPITFLAMIAPMLRTLAHVAAALTAVTMALVLAWLPYNLGLLVAGFAGMVAGAQIELRVERRVIGEGHGT